MRSSPATQRQGERCPGRKRAPRSQPGAGPAPGRPRGARTTRHGGAIGPRAARRRPRPESPPSLQRSRRRGARASRALASRSASSPRAASRLHGQGHQDRDLHRVAQAAQRRDQPDDGVIGETKTSEGQERRAANTKARKGRVPAWPRQERGGRRGAGRRAPGRSTAEGVAVRVDRRSRPSRTEGPRRNTGRATWRSSAGGTDQAVRTASGRAARAEVRHRSRAGRSRPAERARATTAAVAAVIRRPRPSLGRSPSARSVSRWSAHAAVRAAVKTHMSNEPGEHLQADGAAPDDAPTQTRLAEGPVRGQEHQGDPSRTRQVVPEVDEGEERSGQHPQDRGQRGGHGGDAEPRRQRPQAERRHGQVQEDVDRVGAAGREPEAEPGRRVEDLGGGVREQRLPEAGQGVPEGQRAARTIRAKDAYWP